MITTLSVLVACVGIAFAGFDPEYSTPLIFDSNKVVSAAADRNAYEFRTIADCSTASGDAAGLSVLSSGLLVTTSGEVRKLSSDSMDGTNCGTTVLTAASLSTSSSFLRAIPGPEVGGKEEVMYVLDGGNDKVWMHNFTSGATSTFLTVEYSLIATADLTGLSFGDKSIFATFQGTYNGTSDRSGIIYLNTTWVAATNGFKYGFLYASGQNWFGGNLVVDDEDDKGYMLESRPSGSAVQSFTPSNIQGLQNIITSGTAPGSVPRDIALDVESGYMWITLPSENKIQYVSLTGTTRNELDFTNPRAVAFVYGDVALNYAKAGEQPSGDDDANTLFDDDANPTDEDDTGNTDGAAANLASISFLTVFLVAIISLA